MVLPLDYKPAIEAAKKGESVIQAAGSSKLSAALKKLATQLSDANTSGEGGGFLAKLGLSDVLKQKKTKAA